MVGTSPKGTPDGLTNTSTPPIQPHFAVDIPESRSTTPLSTKNALGRHGSSTLSTSWSSDPIPIQPSSSRIQEIPSAPHPSPNSNRSSRAISARAITDAPGLLLTLHDVAIVTPTPSPQFERLRHKSSEVTLKGKSPLDDDSGSGSQHLIIRETYIAEPPAVPEPYATPGLHPLHDDDDGWQGYVERATSAIRLGVDPVPISQGSSGSYFLLSPDPPPLANSNDSATTSSKFTSKRDILLVFKPCDEGPYSLLNPKPLKILQRVLLPCFFGRGCLMPDSEWMSEVSAYKIGRHLGGLVPPTGLAEFKSTIFAGKSEGVNANIKKACVKVCGCETQPEEPEMKLKQGSAQMYLKNYTEAADFFRTYCLPTSTDIMGALTQLGIAVHGGDEANEETENQTSETTHGYQPQLMDTIWTPRLLYLFLRQFQKLIVLDYLIRNTDRSQSNWMVSMTPVAWHDLTVDESGFDDEGWVLVEGEDVKIAAIDNGLAFPYKHPDEWRSYPFNWATLPFASIPFLDEIRKEYLPILTSPTWWFGMLREVKKVWKGVGEDKWERIESVMKGQAWNLTTALKDDTGTPYSLTQLKPCQVWEDEVFIEVDNVHHDLPHSLQRSASQPEGVVGTSREGAELPVENEEHAPLLSNDPHSRPHSTSALRKTFNQTRNKIEHLILDGRRWVQRVKKVEFMNNGAWFEKW